MKLIDLGFSALIPAVIILHLVVAPYTKVEESFNLQAAHDVLVYGTPTSNVYEGLSSTYDHFVFPGVVPRTFTGPVLLAGISQPFVNFFGFEHAQFIVRAVLGLFNAATLLFMKHNVGRAFGVPTGRWYALLQASQFHVMFYASRTLPNMFAFGLTTMAFAFLLPHPNPKRVQPRQRLAISLLTFAAVIFRSEVAILLATTSLYLLVAPQISLERLIPPFIISFVMALFISVPIDSYFWQKPLWPELWGFYYNAVLGLSSNWGIEPWYYYFLAAATRLFVNPLVPTFLIPQALQSMRTSHLARNLVLPSVLFMAIYSLQPHKELRFIYYVVPPLTAAAAIGANQIWANRNKSVWLMIVALTVLCSVLFSFGLSTAMLLISSLNYPGGEALDQLNTMLRATDAPTPVHVHADVLSCMTGVSLFGTSATTNTSTPVMLLDKTEDLATLDSKTFWEQFDYLLMEDTAAVESGQWDEVGVIEGFAGVEVLKPGMQAAGSDLESGGATTVFGNGAILREIMDKARALTGGWWVGPRLEPKVRILKRAERQMAP